MWPFSSSNPTSPPDNASIIATFSPPPNPTPSNLAPPPTHPRISTTALANPSSADKCPVDAETRGKWLQASLGRNDGPSPFVSDGGSRNGNVEGNRNAEAGPSVKTVRGGAPPGKIISAGSFGAGGRRRNEQVQQSDVPARDDSVPDECPVDHQTRKTWLEQAGTATEDGLPTSSTSGAGGFASLASTTTQDSTSDTSSSSTPELKNLPKLSTSRVISSIPRGTGPSSLLEPGTNNPLPPPTIDSESSPEKWVYPSEHQFFLAMLRKNHNPQPKDMSTIVPIHNAVNERTWGEVLKWEEGKGGEECGGVRLVSFRGRPGERSPRAWMNVLLGYTAPFDRHDWVISRCGTEIRYVIDFYTGRSPSSSSSSSSSSSASTPGSASGIPPKDAGNLSFYLDVRPALDGWEGVKMRIGKIFGL